MTGTKRSEAAIGSIGLRGGTEGSDHQQPQRRTWASMKRRGSGERGPGAQLQTPAVRLPIEAAVGSAVARNRLPQVRRPVGIRRLVGLLGAVAGSTEVPVEQSRDHAVAQDGPHRAGPDPDLSPSGLRDSYDSLGRHLGLIDRRHRLGPIGQAGKRVPNCGVFMAGRCTVDSRTSDRSCRSSQRTESVKPCMACLAPQYADCSGIER